MRPGATTSFVWDYFKKNKDSISATCTICKKRIKSHGNTSNLRQHLFRIHPRQIRRKSPLTSVAENDNVSNILIVVGPSTSTDDTSPIQETIPIAEPGGLSVNKREGGDLHIEPTQHLNGGNTNELTESHIFKINTKLLKMITKDFQPLDLVDNERFLEYSKVLQPLYQPPSMRHLSTNILPCYYTKAVSTLKTSMENVTSVAITTDNWTSDSNINYLTVTAHFILDDNLHARVLSTKNLTGENIAKLLRLTLTEWNITDKVVVIVSDNGANIKNAIIEDLQIPHHPCIAHSLNLCVNEALTSNKTLSEVLKKCSNLVNHFKHSTIAREKLKSTQEQMDVPVLKVKQDVATRWNSCYIMLERLAKIKDSLSVCVANLPKSPELPNASEWAVVNDCIQVLNPVNLLTNILTGESYPTISLIVPLIKALQYSLKNTNTSTESGAILKNTLLEAVNCRLGNLEMDKIVAMATFLDPRFKKIGFGCSDNSVNAEKWVTEELNELVANQKAVRTSEDNTIDPETQTVSPEDDLWSHFDKEVLEKNTYSTHTNKVALMVRQYLELTPIHRKDNPLLFWSRHKFVFPEMYQLAIKYLSVPSSSVSCDRVFSKTGQMTNLRRNRLHPKHLDEIIFLNSDIL